MATTHFESVDDYLAAQPEPVRAVLERVRSVVNKAVPGGEEVISYQMPAVRLPGGVVLWFAGWKKHYSVYPATAGVVAAFERELAGYELSKGTIRFPLTEAVPLKLIERIARFRAKEVAEGADAKARQRKAKKVARRVNVKAKAPSPKKVAKKTATSRKAK